MGLSVAIITLDEAHNLPRCLRSIEGLADEIVVVDSLSSDGTQRIAREAGARVVEQAFLGHCAQKQVALEHAREAWVLCLDADEWLDETLRAAIARATAGSGEEPGGYELNRRTLYLGGWIDHGGWSPEWRLRLVRRGRARWEGTDPHDRLVCDGRIARLDGRLNHRPYRDIAHHVEKVNRYTDIMAQRRVQRGERASWLAVLLRPPARFLKMYVLRAGFLDGWRGLLVASMGAYYVFLKYGKLFAATRAPGDEESPAAR